MLCYKQNALCCRVGEDLSDESGVGERDVGTSWGWARVTYFWSFTVANLDLSVWSEMSRMVLNELEICGKANPFGVVWSFMDAFWGLTLRKWVSFCTWADSVSFGTRRLNKWPQISFPSSSGLPESHFPFILNCSHPFYSAVFLYASFLSVE